MANAILNFHFDYLTTSLSQRVAYIQTYMLYISAILSRQGLVVVDNVDGALALGGIDQQYQVGTVIGRTHVCYFRLITYLKSCHFFYPDAFTFDF